MDLDISKADLVQCIMPVLQHSFPKQKEANSQALLPLMMEMRWNCTAESTLQLLLAGNTTRGLTEPNIVTVNTLLFSKEIVGDMCSLLSPNTGYLLEGVTNTLCSADQIAKIIVFQVLVINGASPEKIAKVVGETTFISVFRHSQKFREAFLEAAWMICLINALAGRKLSSVEAADLMNDMNIVSSSGSFFFRLPDENRHTQKFAKLFLQKHVQTAEFPQTLEMLAILSREVDVKAEIEAVLKSVNTSKVDFSIIHELLPKVGSSQSRKALLQRMIMSSVVPNTVKSWSIEFLNDLILSKQDMTSIPHVFFYACLSVVDSETLKVALEILMTFSIEKIFGMVLQANPKVKQYPIFQAFQDPQGLVEYVHSMEDDKKCLILSFMIVYPYMEEFFSAMEDLLTEQNPSPNQKKLAETLRGMEESISEPVKLLLNTTYGSILVPDDVRSTAISWANTIFEENSLFYKGPDIPEEYILEFCKTRLTTGHSWLRRRVDTMNFHDFVAVRMQMEDDKLYGPKLRIHNLAMRVLPFCTYEMNEEGSKKMWKVPLNFRDGIQKAQIL